MENSLKISTMKLVSMADEMPNIEAFKSMG
jgi:hypothetical protein